MLGSTAAVVIVVVCGAVVLLKVLLDEFFNVTVTSVGAVRSKIV